MFSCFQTLIYQHWPLFSLTFSSLAYHGHQVAILLGWLFFSCRTVSVCSNLSLQIKHLCCPRQYTSWNRHGMQIQLKVKVQAWRSLEGRKEGGSASGGWFCRGLSRKRNCACTGKSREGCWATRNPAKTGESGHKGCKEGYGERLENCRRRRLEEDVRDS